MPPIDPEPNEEEKQEQLNQDFASPMSLPSDVPGAGSQSTHPQTDDINDVQEAYDEGVPGMTELPSERESDNRTISPDGEGFDSEPTADEV